ncbi:MAG: hypothetical protein MI864_01925, partial [Pseudomonadales bacterium]|nr:hypothetical protein [Pseudomonadales bacterium]
MQRIALQPIRWFSYGLLYPLSTFTIAASPIPEDFITPNQLILEIRYCECQATETEELPSPLLSTFLKESHLLKVSVDGDQKGFIAAPELSIGYQIQQTTDSPDQFQFQWSGSFNTSGEESTGNGTVLLIEDQWLALFGAQHDRNGSTHY